MNKPFSITFKVSGKPERLNKTLQLHWGKRAVLNKRWYDIIHYAVIRKLPPKPLEKFTIKVVLFNNRHLDFDGSVGSLKPLIDGLERAGVIKDDSYKRTGPWLVTQEKCKKGFEMVEFLITERR